MVSYKTVNENVVEIATGHVVYSGSDATDICQHLNCGGGFDSWTPEFFLIEIDPEAL